MTAAATQIPSCHCFGVYQDERNILSSKQIDAILLSGRKWDLSKQLASGGVVVFPHTYLWACGSYIAAAVHAALDSGADQVLALGVLHSFPEILVKARAQERLKGPIVDSKLRGVHGPKMRRGDFWKNQYSLLSFIFLWKEEIKRRGKKAPKLIIRYPYLVNRQPHSLPGITELKAIAQDSSLVATADFCHHGLAYGNAREQVVTGEGAKIFAKKNVQEHLDILRTNDLQKYYQNCLDIRSDSFDIGPIINHLRGPLFASILDHTVVDTAPLYEGDMNPSWVAASLVQFTK